MGQEYKKKSVFLSIYPILHDAVSVHLFYSCYNGGAWWLQGG
jgi:hypothetical protein